MNILGRQVRLRALEPADAPLLHRWANDPEIWRLLGGWHFPTSLAGTLKWLDGLPADRLNLRFGVERLSDGVLLGTANLVDIDWKNGHAEHGLVLGDPASRGQGYGADTVMAMMRYAFETLRLDRLNSDVIAYNEASLQLFTRKCGWREEGRQRGWHFRDGRRWDRVLIGVTADDYAALIASNRYWDPA
jgi:RimJ/RimL family protein N-acetyltransferase